MFIIGNSSRQFPAAAFCTKPRPGGEEEGLAASLQSPQICNPGFYSAAPDVIWSLGTEHAVGRIDVVIARPTQAGEGCVFECSKLLIMSRTCLV